MVELLFPEDVEGSSPSGMHYEAYIQPQSLTFRDECSGFERLKCRFQSSMKTTTCLGSLETVNKDQSRILSQDGSCYLEAFLSDVGVSLHPRPF